MSAGEIDDGESEAGPGDQIGRFATAQAEDAMARIQVVGREGVADAGTHAGEEYRARHAGKIASPRPVRSAAGRDVVMLILLAERDRFAAELCEYFLRTEGYDVRLAPSAADAQRSFVEHRPNLSVVELTMPGGLDLCRRLARDDNAPVLAVSVLAGLQDEALTAGASAFLPKPFEQLQFVSTVRDLLGASALTRPDRASVP